jgi:fatty acid desaturase
MLENLHSDLAAESASVVTSNPCVSSHNQPASVVRKQFSFAQARSLIQDLNRPKPWIYWTDFLVSIITGHISLHLMYYLPKWYPQATWVWPAVAACYAITLILYMRALMFIHELVHLPRGQFRGFRIAWNALCGVFFLVPSFLYYPHVDHHRRQHYGTDHDGEYLSLSHHGRWMIIGFVLQALIIPPLALFRFLVISPVCWAFPKLRPYVHRHMSTMVVDPFYERNDASDKLMRIVYLQESLCFVWCVWFLIRGGIMRDEWIDPIWGIAYAVGVGILMLNELRTLGAHRWNNQGGEMSFEEQLLDSVNYPNHAWITELWGPVGTRYHALHHLFPSLPYHNLGKAHRRLSEGLPTDSLYHQTSADGLLREIMSLWHRAAENRKAAKATA